jgi:hypothetical protein
MGPVRHCGVLSVAQCRHLRPSPPSTSPSLFFSPTAPLIVFFPELGCWVEPGIISGSDDEVVGESTRSREAQLPGAARDRLLRALAGTAISGLNIVLLLQILETLPLLLSSLWKCRVSDDSSGRAFMPEIS